MNVKESLLEVVKKNNLEILNIDLFNDETAFAKYAGREYNELCKTYTTLESLDFEEYSRDWYDVIHGTVYCLDKDTKEPVWIEPCGDEGNSWWEVYRVPAFYKDKFKQ